ncbi:MAG: MMPL family transporter [Myxococcota bacterium]
MTPHERLLREMERRGRTHRLVIRGVGVLVRHPWAATAVLVLATIGAFLYGRGIEVRSDIEALFPDDAPSVVRARRARRILGNRSELIVLVGSPDRDLNRRVASEIAEGLRDHPETIHRVEDRRDMSFFERNALLYLGVEDLEKLRQEVIDAIAEEVRKDLRDDFEFELDDEATRESGPAADEASRLPSEEELRERYAEDVDLREWVETPDGEVVAVKAYPTFEPTEADRTRALMGLVDRVIADVRARHPDADLETAVEGDYVGLTEAVDQVAREGLRAFLAALAGVALMLVLYFRRLRAVVVTLAALVVGTVWTLAFARLALGSLNVITASIFSVVVGLGVDFVVHATSRTDEELAAGHPLQVGIPVALARLLGAMVWAAVCATATFFSLVVFEFHGFSQFGLIAGIGGLLCLGGAYVVMPPLEAAIARVFPRRRGPVVRSAPAPEHEARPLPRWVGVVTLGAFAGLVLGSALVLPELDFDADMSLIKARVEREESTLRSRYRHEAETHTTSPALIITSGLEETRDVHEHLAARVDDEPLLDGVLSLTTFVPEHQARKMPIIEDTRRRIRLKLGLLEGQAREDAERLLERLDPRLFGAEALPEWLKTRFRDSRGRLGRYVLMYVTGRKSDAEHVLAIQDALGTIRVDGRVYHPTASWFILGEAWSIVKREGPRAVALASLVVLLLLIVDLRRPAAVASVFVPLCVGFVVFMGVLSALDVSLNLFNVIVLPTVFGMGVDTSIHLVHRLREGDDFRRVLHTTGRAAAVSVATDAVGFAALMLTTNEGLRSVGRVAVIGLLTLYATSVALVGAFVAVGWSPSPTPRTREAP